MSLNSLWHKMTATSLNPSRMRLKQYLLMGSVLGVGLLVYYVASRSSPLKAEIKTIAQKEPVPLTPLDAVSSQDVWTHRIQQEAEGAKSEAKAVRDETQLLVKRIEMMEKILQGSALRESKTPETSEAV